MCAWRYWAHQDQERRVPGPTAAAGRVARERARGLWTSVDFLWLPPEVYTILKSE